MRFAYDDEFLYIAATFHEDEPDRLVVNELKRDFNARAGDLFVVILDTFHDRLNAYNFQTNPACALRDSQSYDDGRTINANWDGVWTCRSTIENGVWTVEEAVPFKQLRFPRSDEQVWGLQLFRLVRHTNEQTIWNPTPRQFHQFKTSFAGVLDGIHGVKPGRNIRIKPFTTGEWRHTPGADDLSADGGLDVKVGIGTNLMAQPGRLPARKAQPGRLPARRSPERPAAPWHLLGYTSQARFLINCGIGAMLEAADLRERTLRHPLLLKHEMGDLSKVIGFCRGAPWDALGFAAGDRSHTL